MKYFIYLSQKVGFDISCKLSPILFSGKKRKKKNIMSLSSAELAKRVVKVK